MLLARRGPGSPGFRLCGRLRRWFGELAAHLRLIRRRGAGTFAGNMMLAALQWSARLSIVTALAAGLGAPLEPVRAAVLQWLCFTCMTMMPTPGAAGGAEASFVLVFGRELPEPLLPLAVASWRLLTFYALNIAGLAALLVGWRRLAAADATAAAPQSKALCAGVPLAFRTGSSLKFPG